MQRQAVSMVRHPEDPRFASGTRDLASSLSRFRNNSAWQTRPARHLYRVKTTASSNSQYSAEEIDFLVAYIFPTDALSFL